MISNFNYLFLFIVLFTTGNHYSQATFHVNEHNYYTIRDSAKGVVYSFDSGSEYSNLFDKGKLHYKFGGVSLIQNAGGKFKFIKKGRIKEDIPGLGSVRTNANILLSEKSVKDICIPVDLLLGSRAMKKHKLHFDNKRYVLTSLNVLPDDIESYTRLELKHGFFDRDYYTYLEINGKKEKFLVDTGYSGQVTMEAQSDRVADDALCCYNLVAFKVEETVLRQHSGVSIAHNGIAFKNRIAYSFEKGGLNIIGNAFFLNFEDVIFDLKEKCIYLKNETGRFDPFPDDVLFGPDENNDLHIIYIRVLSDYYSNGFRVGDRIVLQDKELERQLLVSPCETVDILRKWKLNNNKDFAFSKFSGSTE